jgi:hypothetical protein
MPANGRLHRSRPSQPARRRWLPTALRAGALAGLAWAWSCEPLERSNPVDPSVDPVIADGGAELSLVVPLPKRLATVVDSLVARLTGPDIPTVVKALEYDSPVGPATLTIGALSPGEGRVLTIEGYDLTGRLILSGERRDITIEIGDTTRIAIDLRLAVDPDELTPPDTTAAVGDTTVTEPETDDSGDGDTTDGDTTDGDTTDGDTTNGDTAVGDTDDGTTGDG